jgi:site-specific DNA-methyltransferase (adenine-specific)
MKGLADDSVDSIVTDPPYGISFMGRNWDHQVPGVEVWKEALRVLKPGGHLLAFAGTRTQHRMASAIEDAGFEIRDMLAWAYGSGFPKSLDVSKAIDKMDGSATQRENQLRFTAWMRSTGMTAAQQPEVATRDMFEMLRPHLGCEVPDWVEKLVDNRQAESENFKRRVKVGVAERHDQGQDRHAGPGWGAHQGV